MAKTLIQGGTIISMDPAIGDIERGDLLIEDDRIAEVGSSIDAHGIGASGGNTKGAAVIDAGEMIVIPGLINAHLHTWETALRGIGGDWPGGEYFRIVHAGLAPRYSPEDTFLGNLIGALAQIHAGTTTLFDWCH